MAGQVLYFEGGELGAQEINEQIAELFSRARADEGLRAQLTAEGLSDEQIDGGQFLFHAEMEQAAFGPLIVILIKVGEALATHVAAAVLEDHVFQPLRRKFGPKAVGPRRCPDGGGADPPTPSGT